MLLLDRLTSLLVFAAATLVAACPPSFAQQPDRPHRERLQNRDDSDPPRSDAERSNRPRRDRRASDDTHPDSQPGDDAEGRGGPRGGNRRFGDLPFHPTRVDFGPLKPGEDDELLAFAETEVPEAFVRLDRLRRNAPGEFRQRLRDMAPRLRFLRRIFATQPELGRVLVEHIETTMSIERLARIYREKQDGGDRREVMRRLRERMQKRFELEERAMDLHVTDLVNTRDERIDRRMTELTDPATDLSDLPLGIQEIAEKFRSSEDPAARDLLRIELSTAVTGVIDREINIMRERLGRARDDRQERAERILQEMIRRGGRGKP